MSLCPGAPTTLWFTGTAVSRTCAPVFAVAIALASIGAAISASCTTWSVLPRARPAATSEANDQSYGFATRSIIWQKRCAPTICNTPCRFVTRGASREDHAACSCGRKTYPVAYPAEVPRTPTPSAPAVADWSMDKSASGDCAAAAAAGEGLAGFAPAPAAAYDPAFAAAKPEAIADAYVGGFEGPPPMPPPPPMGATAGAGAGSPRGAVALWDPTRARRWARQWGSR